MLFRSTIAPGDVALRVARASASRLEDMSLEEVEGYLIRKTLARFGGNVSRAASALGLSRSALYRRLERRGPCLWAPPGSFDWAATWAFSW